MKIQPLLSVIVGTRNRQTCLDRLVRSLKDHTDVDFELIIADASDVPIDESGLPASSRVIPERPRLGFSKGLNVACRQASGRWTIILNDDCEVLTGYASACIGFMERNALIGVGAIPYSNRGGPFQVNANAFDSLVYPNFPIISTELGNQISWHDEDMRMYGADNSLGFRVLLAGFGIAEVPYSGILHHEHADAQRVENLKGQQEDASRLRAKYEPLLPQMREVYERCRMVTA